MIQFTRTLLLIIGLPLAYLIYNMFMEDKSEHVEFAIPLALMFAAVLVLRHQINSWFLRRTKPALDNELKRILKNQLPHFEAIFSTSNRTESDLTIFTQECDFIPRGIESIPDDLKHLISAHAFYFGNLEHTKWPAHYNRIVLYTHPFLSPQFPEDVHSVEHHHDDGVFVFSLEQVMPGIARKGSFYNIVLHGFADAFLQLYPISTELNESIIWDRLSNTLGINQKEIQSIIGLDEINVLAVVAHYYVYNPLKLAQTFPEFESTLFSILNVEKTK